MTLYKQILAFVICLFAGLLIIAYAVQFQSTRDYRRSGLYRVFKYGYLNPQLGDARQVSLFQLLEVYVVVQIKCLFPAIAPQLFDELAPHPGPEEVSTEPMPATVRAKVIL